MAGAVGHALSRSMRTSVPLPYARKSMASSSTSACDRPGSLLTALRSWRGVSQEPEAEAEACRAQCAYRVCDAVGEADKVNRVVRVAPVGSQGEDEGQCRGGRVGIVVRAGNGPQRVVGRLRLVHGAAAGPSSAGTGWNLTAADGRCGCMPACRSRHVTAGGASDDGERRRARHTNWPSRRGSGRRRGRRGGQGF